MSGSADRPVTAVVLAAGQGKRMRSTLPKVLHEAAGRPLLGWVLAAAREAGCARVVAVIGHGAERVRERSWGAAGAAPGDEEPRFVLQAEQLGTGHALAQAEPEVAGPALLLVLSGDVPLLTAATLEALLAAAREGGAAMAVADLDEPGSLGRVLAGPDGNLERIVEARDATPEVLAIPTVNAGIYALPAPEIFERVRELEPDNAQGELYLTDAVGALARSGTPVRLVRLADPDEALGVNSRQELAAVHRRLVERKLQALMSSGVTVLEPHRTRVDADVSVGADTVIHPDVTLLGRSAVGAGCTLQPGAWVRDTTVGDGSTIEPYSVLDGAEVGPGCRVGPFARLRPGTRLEEGARVGNFVEVKASRLGRGAKANHLAYLGDADVGDGANVGAGAITCNYDGESKHPTRIGAGAFVGSDTLLVAPVEVGEGAVTAAGSVITRDVPAGALAVGRARQKVVEGWSRRRGRRASKKTSTPASPPES